MGNNDSGGNSQDPWNNRKKNQGPPDLDKLFSQFQRHLRGLINNEGGSSSKGSGNMSSSIIISCILGGVLIIWAISGFFIVKPAEQAAILRFGTYVKQEGPGLHWIPPIVDKVFKVNTEMVHQYTYRSEMLTGDESIIDVQISVQYRYADPEAFLFNVANPVQSLQQATASALRQVIGHNTMDDILTQGRALIKQQTKQQLENILTPYHTGIEVSDVNLQSAVPPSQVRDAFDDAIRAQEDERRYKRQAEAYRKQILPAAYGKAKSVLAEAQAYQRNVRMQAQGSTARFIAILPEYQRAPRVTRERMYLSTIEYVLRNNELIFVDSKQSNNLLYLPLDKLYQHSNPASVKPHRVLNSTTNDAKIKPDDASSGSRTQNSQSSYLNIADRDSYLGRFAQ